jgi:acetylornithine/succinyldiaminopimelate/putrescine aminotransferase
MSRLRQDSRISGKIAEVRGRGLFIGVELKEPPKDFLPKALARGVILNLTASKVIRLAPPINIEPDLWDRGLDAAIDTIASL